MSKILHLLPQFYPIFTNAEYWSGDPLSSWIQIQHGSGSTKLAERMERTGLYYYFPYLAAWKAGGAGGSASALMDPESNLIINITTFAALNPAVIIFLGLWNRIHFFRIQIQLFFLMRIRIQLLFYCGSSLKGQCHNIFCHFFISWIKGIWAPDKQAKMVLLKSSFRRDIHEKFDFVQC